MALLTLFLNSFVVGFSGAMMPGPLLAVDIANTPRHGWHTGPVLSIGHAIAEIAVVVLLSVGVAALAGTRLVGGDVRVTAREDQLAGRVEAEVRFPTRRHHRSVDSS